jgi:predicted PurR-regulated permease PerM
VALVLVGVVLAAGSVGIAEATNLVNRFDEATATISGSLASLQQSLGIRTATIDVAALFRQGAARILPDIKTTLATQSGAIAGTVASIVGTISMILILSVFIVSDADGLQA